MAINFNATADVGCTFTLDFQWKEPADSPVDLTNFTASMDVRDPNNANALIINLSTANSRILLGGKTGDIILNISAADMLNIAPTGTTPYNYDLCVNAPGTPTVVTKIAYGTFTVNPTVTATP